MSIRKGNNIIAKSVLGATELTNVLVDYATTNTLAAETTRAKTVEDTLTTNLANEITRATNAEATKLSSTDTTVTKQGNTFNGNNQLVQTTSVGKLPALDGSLLTTLPSSVSNTSLSNLTTAGKKVISTLGMPSGSYISLTLGASGSTYTAPENGYLRAAKSANAVGQYIQFAVNTNYTSLIYSATNNAMLIPIVPVKKDDVVTYTYTLAGSTQDFVFIYAEGSKP